MRPTRHRFAGSAPASRAKASLLLATLSLALGFASCAFDDDDEHEGRAIIRPDQARAVQDLFDGTCAPGSVGVRADVNRADLALPTDQDGVCKASLLPPEWAGEVPDGVRRAEAGPFVVLTAPDCPPACVEQLVDRASGSGFEWARSVAPRGGVKLASQLRTLDEDLRSAVALAVVGVLFWCAIIWLLIRAAIRSVRTAGARYTVAAGLVLLAGLAVFAWLGWERGYRDSDEITDFSQSLVALWSDLRLSAYWMPALNTTVCTLALAPYVVGRALLSAAPLHEALPAVLVSHHVEILWICRVVAAAGCLAIVAIVFRIARAFGGLHAGILAGALAATIAPGEALLHARSYTPYPLAVALSYAFLLVALDAPRATPRPLSGRAAAACGALAGAAFSSHGLALLFAPLMAWIAWKRAPDAWIRRTLVGAGAFVVAYLVINFHIVTDFREYLDNWLYRLEEIVAPEPVPGGLEGAGTNPYFAHLLAPRLWLLHVGLVLAVVSLWHRRHELDWRVGTLVALPVWLLLLLSVFETRFVRYLTYVYPALCLLAGLGLSWLLSRIPWRGARAVGVVGVAALALTAVLPSLTKEAPMSLADHDPLPTMKEVARAHVRPDDEVLLVHPYPAFLTAAKLDRISPQLLRTLGEEVVGALPGSWSQRFEHLRAGRLEGEIAERVEEADWLYVLWCCNHAPIPPELSTGDRRLPVVETVRIDGMSSLVRHGLYDAR